MNGENQKLLLFERVKEQTRWLYGIDKNQREDVAQEAWLLACAYAERTGKKYNDLSATEIKYRCLEAARIVRGKHSERYQEFDESVDYGTAIDPRSEYDRHDEQTHDIERVRRIEWILRTHPTLGLTPRQWDTYYELKNSTKKTANVWRARYARQRAVTRQSVWNTEQIVRRRAQFAQDLLDVWEGKILNFFLKHATSWTAPMIRTGVWPVIRSDTKAPPAMRHNFEKIQEHMFRAAYDLIVKYCRNLSEAQFDPRQYYLIHHLVTIPAYFDSKKTLMWFSQIRTQLPVALWIVTRFVASGFYMVNSQHEREEYKEWLQYICEHDTPESRWCRGYLTHYYSGLEGSHTPTVAEDAGAVVREAYKNMRDGPHHSSELLLDINFLRMLLVLNSYGAQRFGNNTRNALITMCQKSLHSRDRFVTRKAEELLSRVV